MHRATYEKMKQAIAAGRYVSFSEILREALSLWEHQTRFVNIVGVERREQE